MGRNLVFYRKQTAAFIRVTLGWAKESHCSIHTRFIISISSESHAIHSHNCSVLPTVSKLMKISKYKKNVNDLKSATNNITT